MLHNADGLNGRDMMTSLGEGKITGNLVMNCTKHCG